MFISPSFKKSLIVEQFQGNYLKQGEKKSEKNAHTPRKKFPVHEMVNAWPKLRNTVAGTNVSQLSRGGNVCCGNKFCCSDAMYLPGVKNIFASRTQVLPLKRVSQFSHHERNVDKQCYGNGGKTTMGDGKVEAEGRGKGKELEGREDATHCFVWLLRDVAHEDCM